MTRLMSLLSCMALTTHLAAQAPTLPPERQALWREIRLLNDSVEAAFNRGITCGLEAIWGTNLPGN